MRGNLAYGDEAHRPPSRGVDRDQRINHLVESFMPMVASLVDRTWVAARLGLTRDDLFSAGAYGLLMAARRFDPQRGVAFPVFARWHVRGAVLREINGAVQTTGADEQHAPAASSEPIEPESLPDSRSLSPGERVEAGEVHELMEYVLNLQERSVLKLYFFQGMTLTEIAQAEGSTKNAVTRTIKTALHKLRSALDQPSRK